jgi:hypothetical protein
LLWHEWANCNRKQELAVFRDLPDSYAQSPRRFVAKSPIISPKIPQDIVSLNFIGDHRDDVNIGLSPFNVIESGEAFRRHNLELSKVQGTLFQNEIGFNLSDLDALQERELKAVPLCFFDLEKTLGLFGNLLAVVLGESHIITTTYRHFWELLSSVRDDIRDQIDIQSVSAPHTCNAVFNWVSIPGSTPKNGTCNPPHPTSPISLPGYKCRHTNSLVCLACTMT